MTAAFNTLRPLPPSPLALLHAPPKYLRRHPLFFTVRCRRHTAAAAAQREDDGHPADWIALPAAEVPDWMVKKGLSGGYRPPNLPWGTIVGSAFRLHNETGNIWSHFLAALAALALAFTHLPTMTPPPPPLTSLFLRAYPLAAAVTFLTSTAYHLFQCRSHRVNKMLRSCDFQSILLLVTASYLPALNLAYAANPALYKVYLALVFAVYPFSSIGVAISGAAGKMAIKNFLIVLSAFWGIIPTLQTLTNASLVPAPVFFIKGTALMWGLYAFGGLIYGMRAPERYIQTCNPNNSGFNVLGSSHQWWHIFTILAACSWYIFLQKYYLIAVAAGVPLR